MYSTSRPVRWQQTERPVNAVIRALKHFESTYHYYVFGTETHLSTPTSRNTSTEPNPNLRPPSPEPVRVFRLQNFLKPEFAGLNLFMDRETIGGLCYLQQLLDWILFGYDDIMKGELMAHLETEGFKIVEVEFEDNRLNLRPVLETRLGMIMLGNLDEPYHKGGFQYLHEHNH